MAKAAEFHFSANAKQVIQTINNVQGRLGGLQKKSKAAAKPLQQTFTTATTGASALQSAIAGISFAGLAMGAMKAASMVTSMAKAAVSAAADLETYNVRFEVLLGSAEKAQQHVSNLTQFAAETPFEMEGISKASATLLAFGVEARDSMAVLKMLGDVAAGSGASIEELARIYGKVTTAGKMDTADINQLGDRGLNVRAMLAARDGLSMDAVRRKISSGGYGVSDLRYVLEQATGEGGMFQGGMQKLSQTFSGMLATFQDALTQLGATLGQSLLPGLKKMVETGTSLVEAFAYPLKKAFVDLAGLASGIGSHLRNWSPLFMAAEAAVSVYLRPLREMYDIQRGLNASLAEMAKMGGETLFETSFDRQAAASARERGRYAQIVADAEAQRAADAERAAKAAEREYKVRSEMRRTLAGDRAARAAATDMRLFETLDAAGMASALGYRYQQATGATWNGYLSESDMTRAEDAAAATGNAAALAELRRLREFQQLFETRRAEEVEEKDRRHYALEAARSAAYDESAIFDARERGDMREVQLLEGERDAAARMAELMALGMGQQEAASLAAAAAGRQHGVTQTSSPGEWLRDDLAAIGGGGNAVRIPSAQLQIQKQQLNAAHLTNQLLQRLLNRPGSLPVTI